jgi:hypothetical protein
MAAEARTKKKKRYHAPPHAAGQSRYPSGSDYQEALADKLPFGTARWWQQMDREGRGGQGRPN